MEKPFAGSSETDSFGSPVGVGLGDIPLSFIEQFSFQHSGQFNNSFVVFIQCITGLGREYRNTVVDVVMEGEVVAFEAELPVYGVEIVFFVAEFDLQVFAD